MESRIAQNGAQALLASMATIWIFTLIATNAQGAPHERSPLEPEQPAFDFGTLNFGVDAIRQYAFRLKNIGSDEVEISRIKSSCGCTSAVADRTKIRPGETTIVTADVDWSQKPGAQIVTIDVHTAAEVAPVTLSLRGYVTLPLLVSHSELHFPKLRPGERRRQSMQISKGNDGVDFRITAVNVDSPNLTIERSDGSPLVGASGEFEIVATGSDKPIAEHVKVVFETDHPNASSVTVVAVIAHEGAFRIVPEKLFFSRKSEDQERRSIELHDEEGLASAEFTLTGPDAAVFRVAKLREVSPRKFEITLEFDRAAARPGRATAELNVKGNAGVHRVPMLGLK